MQALGTQKKQGSIVEAISQAIPRPGQDRTDCVTFVLHGVFQPVGKVFDLQSELPNIFQ